MHSSRMRTACSLTECHASPPPCHACPPTCHAPHHACPPAMHTTPATHAPPHATCPPAMHTPCHACPPATYAPPHPVDRILDTPFWKYYLAPTSLRAVKMSTLPTLCIRWKLERRNFCNQKLSVWCQRLARLAIATEMDDESAKDN